MENKYEKLTELAEVFAAMDKIKSKKQQCTKCKKYVNKNGCWAFTELLAWGSPCPAWTDDPDWWEKLHETVEKYKIHRWLP